MSIESTSLASPTFSAAIRQRTLADHERAEGSAFIRALFAGEVSERGYVRYLAQLQAIYALIEDAASVMRPNPQIAPFADPALERSRAIQADLATFGADRWPEVMVTIRATTEYCDRLRRQCFDWPGGFVAHHYTRYLGDLSGGRAIAAAVGRSYGLDGEEGRQLYAFPAIPDRQEFKVRYRAALDQAPWSVTEQERILDEITEAYRLNAALLDDLGIA